MITLQGLMNVTRVYYIVGFFTNENRAIPVGLYFTVEYSGGSPVDSLVRDFSQLLLEGVGLQLLVCIESENRLIGSVGRNHLDVVDRVHLPIP